MFLYNWLFLSDKGIIEEIRNGFVIELKQINHLNLLQTLKGMSHCVLNCKTFKVHGKAETICWHNKK